jgi:arginyl-tRNA synthetase
MQNSLKEALRSALKSCGVDAAAVKLEHPSDLAHGDYATGAALQYAKQAGLPPRALAEQLVAALSELKGVEKIEIAGPGFINFHLSSAALATEAERARTEDMWGVNGVLSGKKIMIDYTQPNPFKPFHIGHLMSNAIGESLARLFQFSGAQVVRVNYQGDVGPHVAKALWAM